MSRLPAPPRFTLPPPPPLPLVLSKTLNRKLLLRLTCSSIRQQQRQMNNIRLILISFISFLILLVIITLILMLIKFFRRRQRTSIYNEQFKTLPKLDIPSQDTSINSSRSYDTISSEHAGVYVKSFNTSATTCSTEPSHVTCLYCQYDHVGSHESTEPYYHTIDKLIS